MIRKKASLISLFEKLKITHKNITILDNCGVALYQCKNGACIRESLICDRNRDCQEGEDEEDCSKSKLKFQVLLMLANILKSYTY